jgi:phosphopantetheinyl transferase
LTGVAPENVEIIVDHCGKPCLTLPAVATRLPTGSLLKFNVSHSENLLCIATTLGCDVGVDIEVVNPGLDVLAISQACLDQTDNDQIRCSSPSERSLVFYRLWTRREAFAKMMGHGVSSDHVHRTPTLPWSLGSLEFTLGEKQIVGSLVIGAPRTTLAGVFETIP